MVRIFLRATLLVVALTAGPASAAVLDYTSFHVLGDSLSDTGNVWRNTAHLKPQSPPYWRGRFSNGRVWSERTAAAFKAKGLPTSNEAWGGAKAKTDADGLPDLTLQAYTYRHLARARRGSRPLVAIWIGANDILRASNADKAKAGRQAAAKIGDVAQVLAASGVKDFLIFNMPDLGRVPKYKDDLAGKKAATAGVRSFNRRINSEISDLREAGLTVRKVDTYRLFNDLLDNPRDYRLRNVTTPCIDADDNVCSRAQGRGRAFFDNIHPNYRVHDAISQAALGRIGGSGASVALASASAPSPVPVPASAGLLGAALVALAALAGRRTRRA